MFRLDFYIQYTTSARSPIQSLYFETLKEAKEYVLAHSDQNKLLTFSKNGKCDNLLDLLFCSKEVKFSEGNKHTFVYRTITAII